MITLMLIAFSLALDCFAVSAAGGACNKKPFFKNAVKAAFAFGLFQAIMPLVGWLLGQTFSRLISGYNHWIAFGLLMGIGIKMIYESLYKKSEQKKDMFILSTLLLLAVATSIDALVAGISLGLLQTPLAVSVTVIGIFAFMLTIIGYYMGHWVGTFLKNKAEIAGGILLMGIGIKILVENLI